MAVIGNNPRSIRVELGTIKSAEEVEFTRKIERFVIFFRLLAPLATRLMHATWRKAAGIRRFAEPIPLPLQLFCALQTQYDCLTKTRLLHSAVALRGGLVKPASPPQYPSQSQLHAGSLDAMSRFGATSRVIFAFDHAVSDEDDF